MNPEAEVFERYAVIRRIDGQSQRVLASDGRDRLFPTMSEAERFAASSGMKPAGYSIMTVFVDAAGNPTVRRIHT